MRSSLHTLDRVGITFDDDHAVVAAGLLLPATLAQHLGLERRRTSWWLSATARAARR